MADRKPHQSGAGAQNAAAPLHSEIIFEAELRPHRSLTRGGVVWLLGIVFAGLLFTLIPFLGTSVAWVLLGFKGATLLMLGGFILAHERAAVLTEHITLCAHHIRVDRYEPSGRNLSWEANPYWVEAHLHQNHRIEDYLTLKGGGREIEIGAFLTPEARRKLYRDVTNAIARIR